MEEGMVESTAESMGSPAEASVLPFLLLVAMLAAGYWMWSSRAGESRSSGVAAPLPNAEELRRKRLEALQASIDASKASASAADGEDGLRKRSMKVDGAAEVTRSREESDAPAEQPKATPKQPEKQMKQPEQPKPEPKATQCQSPPVPTKESHEMKAEVELESTFALRARATLKGSSHVRNVEVQANASVEQLQCEVLKAFPEAAGSKVRIFFNGKELKTLSDKLNSLGFSSNVCLQVMFATQLKQEVEEAERKEDGKDVNSRDGLAEQVPPPEDEPLSVRIQSTVKGHTSAFVLKELTTCSTVLDLEALCLGTFAPGDCLRPRLFFMGRELKEGSACLGNLGLKPKAMATVQVMFAAGEPRATAKTPVSEAAVPLAEASAAAGGNPSPPVQEGTNEAVLAAAAAAGCNVSALLGGDAAEQAPEDGISPAEAWRAMAGLEEQLSRETDMSEEPSARQASMMLRQLLTTATHDSNPGLMQMAQSAVPDLKKIWSFEPTREHLKGLLAMKAQ